LPKLALSRNPFQGKPKPGSAQDHLPEPAFPAGSWVPFIPISDFTGREAELDALAKIFSPSSGLLARVIVFGKPGSGKTQLALAFSIAQGSQFQSVHWIEAGDPVTIGLQIAACGRAMQISPWPEKMPDQVEATLKAWRQSPRRLIILNHVDDLAVLNQWMNKFPASAFLITSSRIETYSGFSPVHLGALRREESTALLCKRSPRLEKASTAELDRLASQLNNLAFAVELAGRYLDERAKVLPYQYQAEIEKTASSSTEVIDNAIQDRLLSLTPAQAAVVLLSLRLLEGKGERERLAWRILTFASLCVPSLPLPVGLLFHVVEGSQDIMAVLERSLDWLYSLGLLQQTSQGPAIHPIVARLAYPENTTLGEVLAPAIDSLIASRSVPSPKAGVDLNELPHIRALAAAAEGAGLKQAGELLNILGSDLRNAGELSEARVCLERGLELDEGHFGVEHVRIAAASRELGRVFSDLGDLYAAKRCYERAIAITEKLFSPSYPEVANILNDLGQILYDLRDLFEAKTCFERAISIYESAYGYGPKHPALAAAAGNLGRVLRDMDDLQGAKASFERALAIDEWVFGPRHPKIAARANYLGRLCYSLGDLNGARSYFERVTSILEESGEAEDATLATAHNNLGLVLQDLGNISRAQASFARALEIDEKILGSEHPNVARDLNNLGGAYAALENYPAARNCFIRAMQMDEKIFGLIHPNNAANANNLGRVLYNMGDFKGAREAFEHTLMIDEKLNGPMHTKVGTDLNNLGIVFYETGDLDKAKACFERALEIFSREYSADHPKVSKAKKYLDRILQRLSER